MGDSYKIGVELTVTSEDAAISTVTDKLRVLDAEVSRHAESARQIPIIYASATTASHEMNAACAELEQAFRVTSKAADEDAAAFWRDVEAEEAAVGTRKAATDAIAAKTSQLKDEADAQKRVENSTDAMTASLEDSIIEWFSLVAVFELAKEALKAVWEVFEEAIKDEHLMANLERNARMFAGATEEQARELRSATTAMVDYSGIGESRVIPYMNKLIAVTHNVNDTQKLTQLAMDLERQGLSDMESTYLAITAAYEGVSIPARGFGRILISNHKEGETWIETLDRLSDSMAASAREITDTVVAQEQLNTSWEHAKEAMGELAGPFGGAIIKTLTALTYGIRALVVDIKKIGFGVEIVAQQVAVFGYVVANLQHPIEAFKEAQHALALNAEDGFSALDKEREALERAYQGLPPIIDKALEGNKDSARAAAEDLKKLKKDYELLGLAAEAESHTEKEAYNNRHTLLQLMLADTRLDLESRLKAAAELGKMEIQQGKRNNKDAGKAESDSVRATLDAAKATEELAKQERAEAEAAFRNADAKTTITKTAQDVVNALRDEKTAVMNVLISETEAKIKAANGNTTAIQAILKAAADKSLAVEKDYSNKEIKIWQDAAKRRAAINKNLTEIDADEEKKRFDNAKKQADAYDKLTKTIADKHAKTYKKMSNDELHMHAQKLREEIAALQASGAQSLIVEQAISDATIKIKELEHQILVNMMKDAAMKLGSALAQSFGVQKEFAYAQAIINTYLGATNALTTGDPYTAVFRAAAVVVAGMADVIQIANTNPGKAAKGAYLTEPTHVLAGEAGPEYILPPDVSRFITAAVARQSDIRYDSSTVTHNNQRGPTIIAHVSAFSPAEGEANARVMVKRLRGASLSYDRTIAGGSRLIAGSVRGPRWNGRA